MRLLLLFAAIIIGGQLNAQGMDFFHGTWEEALAEAKAQDKIIFVDAYATWCGPCKRMAKNVFPNSKVGDFYNKHFINMKLDMERGEGLTFRKKYPVSAFPTLYYIDYTGEVVHTVRGAQSVDGFIDLGHKALGMIDRTANFAEAYDKGERDPELIYNYIKALNQAGKSSLKVANDYFDTQTDLTTEQNLKMIMVATTESDSKIFDWLIENQKAIEALHSAEEVNRTIREACHATAKKAIEFQSEYLLEVAIDKLKKHYDGDTDAFEIKSEMDFYLAMGDADKYIKASKKYVKKEAKNDTEEIYKLATLIRQKFWNNQKAMDQAEDYAKTAAERSNRFDYYLTYADILSRNGKISEAKKAASYSMELAKQEGPHAVQIAEQMMQKIGS